MNKSVIRTERGWPGHYCAAARCMFRRNTLLEYGEARIVVSTVGLYRDHGSGEIETVGCGRHYETMAFRAKFENPYWEADVSREVSFESKWQLFYSDGVPHWADKEANEMHEAVVAELTDIITLL